jgi:hypothetical protein
VLGALLVGTLRTLKKVCCVNSREFARKESRSVFYVLVEIVFASLLH